MIFPTNNFVKACHKPQNCGLSGIPDDGVPGADRHEHPVQLLYRSVGTLKVSTATDKMESCLKNAEFRVFKYRKGGRFVSPGRNPAPICTC
jgi:hypothetical protein